MKQTFSYFVICADYGRHPRNGIGPCGREAIVDPEMTRRGAVEKVGELLGDGISIAFVHHITMNDTPEDVTIELMAEVNGAWIDDNGNDVRDPTADRLAARFDHARDYRKHAAAE